jgi:hypothetical protein
VPTKPHFAEGTERHGKTAALVAPPFQDAAM